MAAIEQDFPTGPLSALAELESWRKELNRPIYHMHKWWATRLGSVFRAILIGALSEDGTDIWKSFYAPTCFPDKIILDPFMGAGTTLGEALKLGCKVIGSDINPVSAFQVRKALEPVDVYELTAAFERLKNKAQPQIRQMYQSIDPESGIVSDILYCFWVMTVPCPACQKQVPLFDTSIFAKHAYPQKFPAAQSICFACGQVNATVYDNQSLKCAGCQREYNPQVGITDSTGTKATCLHCGVEFRILDVVAATVTPPLYEMYALLIVTPDGHKKYIRASEADRKLYEKTRELVLQQDLLLPTSKIEPGHNTNQILRYNYREWRQLFNYRQQYCLSLLLQTILEEQDTACRELLLLLFSSILEYNNMFCSYKGGGTGAVRPIFNHHILKPERMALENTVWGIDRGSIKSSGSFLTFFHSRLMSGLSYRQKPFELRAIRERGKTRGEKVYNLSQQPITSLAASFDMLGTGKHKALLLCTDSSSLPLPDQSIDAIVTDPPYFDFVHYSELADFFYAWLRLGLQETRAEFRAETTRHPREVQQRDASAFTTALRRVFQECTRVLKPDGLLIFSFHHSRNDGWEAIGQAIFEANLRVVAAHPIKAEMSGASPKAQAEDPINYDAILICKQQVALIKASLEAAIRDTLERTREKLQIFMQDNRLSSLSNKDRFVIMQAQALCVYSQHIGLITDAAGAPVTLSCFLAATSSRLGTLSEVGIQHENEVAEKSMTTLWTEGAFIL
jgi:putative DNA methylase